jgi:drug/metabolite transporter superfamily protein YnfA
MAGSKQSLYLSSTIIALGVVMTTSLAVTAKPIGLVFIAIGGIFFILSMKKKKEEDKR